MTDELATAANAQMAKAILQGWGSEVQEATSSRRAAKLQYWRKCNREGCPKHTDRFSGINHEQGWIVLGASISDPLEHARLINSKHMEPLAQYGTLDYGGGSEATMPATRFKQILEKDGLKEFPVSQMQAYGWDRVPEVVAARPEVALQRVFCTHGGCVNRSFVSEDDLAQHIQVKHADIVAPQAIGKVIQDGLRASQPQAVDPVAIASAVSAAITQLMQAGILSSPQQAAPEPPIEVENPGDPVEGAMTVAQYRRQMRQRQESAVD